LHALAENKRAAWSERGQLIKKLTVNPRNNFTKVTQILGVLKAMNDKAVAL